MTTAITATEVQAFEEKLQALGVQFREDYQAWHAGLTARERDVLQDRSQQVVAVLAQGDAQGGDGWLNRALQESQDGTQAAEDSDQDARGYVRSGGCYSGGIPFDINPTDLWYILVGGPKAPFGKKADGTPWVGPL